VEGRAVFTRPGPAWRHNEQGFDGLERGVQLFDFAHHGFVHRQSSGGVDEQHVEVVAAGEFDGAAGDVQRFVVGRGGKNSAPACAVTVCNCAMAAGR
jgi:hypothetical protein